MEIQEHNSIFREITDRKELNELEGICNKFNITMKSIYRVKDKFKVVDYCDNVYCLKKIKRGKGKTISSYNLTKELYNYGFFNIPFYISTSKGNMYVKNKDSIFFMVQWIHGEGEHFKNMEETIQCAKLLGIFQNLCGKINLSSYRIPYTIKDWPKLYKYSIMDMEKYKKIIENKILKTEFDYVYYKELNYELNIALNCLKILNTSSFYALKRQCEKNKIICYNNISSSDFKKHKCNLYFVDLDNISIDLTIMDLQKFIRHIMNKKGHEWNFSKAEQIIEAYTMVNPLSNDELIMMIAFICFPYKFWKLGKKRYIKHKNYSDEKYMNKLNKILLYKNAKEKFFHDYMNYVNNSNKM